MAAELVGRATVTDGDTLTVSKQRIRLWGIDAPESNQLCIRSNGRSWPCGRRSAAALDDYLLDKTVRCQPKDTDHYGRVVAECFLHGESVNRWMVSSGWAVAYRQYSTSFVADESIAQQHKLNIWSGSFQLPADFRRAKRASSVKTSFSTTLPVATGCNIKGNLSRNGKRIFHMPGQRDYERTYTTPARGKRMFCTPTEALKAGWQPARR
ncbi:thermonuclease family protein [Xanthomonas phaseoli]|uniref:thermonuclease family protein n=1 Tax=Xanthomonas phaseoli TaxID=1985254 RepID=UPI001ADCD1F9|nr:thermonuclease family protein [Xanthomonas phaseoli pv. dieffenbachiae]MBO9989336.1 thermonuclease family protein [Xanthomonas phaseoli pv. dieffenbachiae]